MSMERSLVNTLLEKNAQLEKRAFITHLLKPLNKSLKGDALVSRIAPMGRMRYLADFGHGMGNLILGAGLGVGAYGLSHMDEVAQLLKHGPELGDAIAHKLPRLRLRGTHSPGVILAKSLINQAHNLSGGNPVTMKLLAAGGFGGLASSGLGQLLNQSRANKYLDRAIGQTSSRLSKAKLKDLYKQMGSAATYFGADNPVEFFSGMSARKKLKDAIGSRAI